VSDRPVTPSSHAPPSGQVEARLRRLTCNARDETFPVGDAGSPRALVSGLEPRAEALVRLASLVAMRAPASSYRCTVEAALQAGATHEDLIGTVIAVASTVGLSRLVSASVGLALALGDDIDAALEWLDPTRDERR
jgi:alkylhydroperoxidase/carboxymuconolactone decarboxylase family protein YurZ